MTYALRLDWFKSTRSAGSSHCIEAAVGHNGDIFLRDSKNPQSGILTFDSSTWRNFVESVKSGDFSNV